MSNNNVGGDPCGCVTCGCFSFIGAGAVLAMLPGSFITWIIVLGVVAVFLIIGAAFSPSIPVGRRKYSTDDTRVFADAAFAAAGYVEAGEGEIPQQSLQQAVAYASRLASGDAQLANSYMAMFSRGEAEYQSKLNDVLNLLHRDSRMRYFLLNMISDIATADLNISQSELQRFVEVAGILGVGASEAQQILRSNLQFKAFTSSFSGGFGGAGGSYGGSQQGAYQGREETDSEKAASGRLDLKRAYEILNVSSSDDDGSIKKAYRREANKHHPDKLRARGLPESMIKAETEKFELCNAAWEVIKQARGLR